jgi:hypothetical protein
MLLKHILLANFVSGNKKKYLKSSFKVLGVNQMLIFSTDFLTSPKYQILRKLIYTKTDSYEQTDGQTFQANRRFSWLC